MVQVCETVTAIEDNGVIEARIRSWIVIAGAEELRRSHTEDQHNDRSVIAWFSSRTCLGERNTEEQS